MTEILGPNLFDAVIKEKKSLHQPELQTIIRDVLLCLRQLKSKGIIHCDLKPENIVFRNEISKNVKVIDFGSATFIGDSDYDYLQTRPYRAPEVAFGSNYDFMADMWSLGCIIYELVTSRVLFSYQSVAENLAKAFSINHCFTPELFSDGTKKKKYLTSTNLLFVEQKAARGEAAEVEIVVPRLDFDLTNELRHEKCDRSLVNLIQRCLVLDPGCRITVEEALNHEFLLRGFN